MIMELQVKLGGTTHRSGDWYIWSTCFDCEKGRWVRLIKGKPRSLRCAMCSSRLHGTLYLGHRPQNGELNPNWKGGVRLFDGYIMIYLPDHPHAGSNGYVPHSILVLEAKLNRHLLPNCIAHHINNNRGDDRPENLMEITLSDHARLHRCERIIKHKRDNRGKFTKCQSSK